MEIVKLVIWDLDETFWCGTLSEGGIEAIADNVALIKTLTDKGIVNSICSKNDFDKTKAALEELGVWDLFVFPSIDWTNKGVRVKRIIDAMQLRAVNVLFVDDNINNLKEAEFECAGLQTALPDQLPDLIKTPAFAGKKDLQHTRLQQYKILEQKAVAQAQSGSNDEFLYQSDIRVNIVRDWAGEIDRVHEIINRTNQLNFTKVRLERDQVEQLLKTADDSGLVHATDKYGDHGYIGFFAVKDKVLQQFAFSCRMMGAGIEQYVYSELGFPRLEVVGEVANEVNASDRPGWINQSLVAPDPEAGLRNTKPLAPGTSQTTKKTPKLFIYGGCILRPIQAYVQRQLDDVSFIEDVSGAFLLPALNLAGIWRYDELQRAEWTDSFTGFHPKSYDSAIAADGVDYLLISLVGEFNIWKYTRKDNPDICFYASRPDPKVISSDLLDNFTAARVSDDDILREMRYLADHFEGTLIILTAPEYQIPGQGESEEYWARIRLNKAAEILAAEKANIRLLDMRHYMNSAADSLDGTPSHYNRQVGYKLAMGLLELMGERAGKEEVRNEPPSNAVRRKSPINPTRTDDEPEYVAYIRNGYFHCEITIANTQKYEFKFIYRLGRKTLEETGYIADAHFRRALTHTGDYWVTVSVREKGNPFKEYRFHTTRIPYTEHVLANYIDPKLSDFEDHLRGLTPFFSQYPASIKLRRHWTQQLLFLKSHGVTIADYFKRKGITDVSLYSDQDLYPVILESLEGVDYRLRYKFTDDWLHRLQLGAGFGSGHIFHEWNDAWLGPLDTVLIAKQDMAFFGGDTAARVKATQAKVLRIDEVLDELVTDLLFNKILPQTLAEKNMAVPIIVFEVPNNQPSFVCMTPSDRQVSKFEDSAVVLKARKEASDALPSVWRDVPLEELEETLKQPDSHRLPDDVSSWRDVSGKYLNVVQGRRKTVGQPDTYQGTIYLFGNRGLFGRGVKDEDTIASRLQAIMPDYRVENYSNYWGVHEWESAALGRLIQSIDFKPGDIICLQFVSGMREPVPRPQSKAYVEAIDKPLVKVACAPLFQNANQPDLFLFSWGSLTPWGNARVAELLRDTILELPGR